MKRRKALEGIEERPSRSRDGQPSYRASVIDQDGKRIRYTCTSLAEAQQWRRDAKLALRRGRLPQGRNLITMRVAAAEWARLAEQGVIRTNRGELYKPAALRAYSQHLRMRVLDKLGDEPMADLTRTDWQTLVDNLLGEGSAPATIAGTVAAVSAVFKFEVSRGRLKDNPLHGLDVPTPDNGRERFASPVEAAALLAAVPANDRAVWATAMYAGLRCGELQALPAENVRLDDGHLFVEFGWDRREGKQATKGKTKRKVPIPAALREHLAAELLRTGRRGGDLIFGATPTSPFRPAGLQAHADKAWKAAKLERLTFHDCRHTYASFAIAAGVNVKALSTYMGHSGISITLDRYGHLLPGSEEEAAGLLDAYLERNAV